MPNGEKPAGRYPREVVHFLRRNEPHQTIAHPKLYWAFYERHDRWLGAQEEYVLGDGETKPSPEDVYDRAILGLGDTKRPTSHPGPRLSNRKRIGVPKKHPHRPIS